MNLISLCAWLVEVDDGSRRYSSLIAQCLRPYIQSFRAELVGSVPQAGEE